jgi:AraC family transcriptional regulator
MSPVPTWDLRLSSAPELLCVAAVPNGNEARMNHDLVRGGHLYFYKHEATLVLGDSQLEVAPGSVSVIPPGVSHQHRDHDRAAYLYAHFVPRAQTGDAMPILALQDLGPDFTSLCERFEHAVQVFAARPAQAEARLWDVLWELSERTAQREQRQSRRHVALDRACRVIQSRLADQLSLSDLATPAGVSPAHLTRLFRAEMGLTATDYLRRCRLERALHLLTRSEVAIKQIACEVGIPDLHAFNKAIRRGFGISPRELRSRGTWSPPLLARASSDVVELTGDRRSASPSFLDPPLTG